MALNFLDRKYFPAELHPWLEHTERGRDFSYERVFSQNDGLQAAFELIDPQLSFTIQGLQLFPFRMNVLSKMSQNVRGRILSLFGFGKKPEMNVESRKKIFVTFGSEALVRAVFPDTPFEKLGDAFIIDIPEENPVYVKQSAKRDNRSFQNIDRRNTVQEQSLLSPEMRSRLEACGKIVYEGDPTGKNRLLVCFKHGHGFLQTYANVSATNPQGADSFALHQRVLYEFMQTELSSNSNHLFFLESFPRPGKNTEESDLFLILTRRAAKVRKALEKYRNTTDPAICLALKSMDCDWQTQFIDETAKTGNISNLRGDGRDDLKESLDGDKERLEAFKVASKSRNLTSIEKQHWQDIEKRREKTVIESSNRALAMEVAKEHQEGQTAFVVYGGAHFSSGYSNDRTHPLESHLSLIPHTQLIVVEPIGYKDVDAIARPEAVFVPGTLIDTHKDVKIKIEKIANNILFALAEENDELFISLANQLYALRDFLKNTTFVPTLEQPKPPKVPKNIEPFIPIPVNVNIVIDSNILPSGNVNPLNNL